MVVVREVKETMTPNSEVEQEQDEISMLRTHKGIAALLVMEKALGTR